MNVRLPLQIAVWVYCLSWAFDYRAAADSGGSPVQYVFFAITLASAVVVVLLGFRRLFALPLGWITLGWMAYMASTPVVALLNHVELAWYLRNAIPPLLLLTSLCVTQVAAASGLHWRDVLWPMLIASVVNVLWRIFYALFVAGIPIEMVRVELLSPCLPFLMGYLLCGLALSRRVPWLAILVGAVGTLSYVLSVTRSAVLILGAAGSGAIVALWLARREGALPKGFGQLKLAHLLVMIGLLIGTAGVTVVGFPLVIERWTERLFNTAGGESSSADPSALTRYAETRAFYDLLNQDPMTWIYGRGLGAPYYWDESYAVELAQYTYGNEDLFRSESRDIRFPGHSIWTYAVFSGGVIGGVFYLGLFGLAVWISLHSTRALRRVPDYPVEIAFMPFIALMAFLSQSLTFIPFIERCGGLVLGIVIGFPQFLYHHAWRGTNGSQARRL